MIEKVMCDYVALREMFNDITPEKERAVKIAVRKMIETEEYSYLKYKILQRAVDRIERGVTGASEVSMDFIQSANLGEEISNSLDIKEIKPRVSYFRPENSKSNP